MSTQARSLQGCSRHFGLETLIPIPVQLRCCRCGLPGGTQQYIVAGEGALANSSRNTLQMNPINSWDLTLLKRISITERYKVEFAAQLFNAFNHPNWVPGFLNQVNSVSRTDQGERNSLIPNKPNFNSPEATWGSNPRTMQLYLKFIF